MNRIENIINILKDVSQQPAKAIKNSMEETGKKAVGCFPLYTPEEIVYASGMIPVGLWGGQKEIKKADKYLQSFCCSIMRENMENGLEGSYDFLSAIIIPAYCDTLKCVCENWKVAVPDIPMIAMVYPQNRKISAGTEYLVNEYERVKDELEKISGNKITEKELEKSIDLYEEYRKTMSQFVAIASKYLRTIDVKTRHMIIKAAYFTDKKWYIPLIKELITELYKLPEENFGGIKVVATGIMAEPETLLDTLVQNDIAFAADDLAHESRQFRTGVPDNGKPLEKLALRITHSQKCSLLYDEQKSRGNMLVNLVKESNADGIVIFMMKFCDPEEFDYPIYKKELEAAKIPMLYLEIEQKMDSVEQIRTRIQSFKEMLTG